MAKKKSSNKLYIIFINIGIFIILVIALWFIARRYWHINDETYVNDAQVKAYINPINSRVSGYIDEVRFTEHQRVKKGDTLVVIDASEIETAVEQAQAALAQAYAAKTASETSILRVSNNVNTVNANITGAKAQMDNALADMERYKNLLEQEAVTRQQYEQVQTRYKSVEAQYNSLLEQRNTARLSTQEAKSRIALNDAQIKQAEAALERAQLNRNYAIITSPSDGIMGRRNISEGQLIQPGQQIATLVQDGEKWVEANLLEKQLGLITEGQNITFTIDAMGDEIFKGTIAAISGATGSQYSIIPTDNSTGNFVKVQQRIPVRINFTENNKLELLDRIRVGMNVVIELDN